MLSSKISIELQVAYRETICKVFAKEKEIQLEIGNKSLEMDFLLGELGFDRYAFLTAANPRSALKSESENKKRNLELENNLIRRQFIFLTGVGASQNGNWQEESFCIFGMDLEIAKKLAKEFEQNAFVFGMKNGVPEIVYCI